LCNVAYLEGNGWNEEKKNKDEEFQVCWNPVAEEVKHWIWDYERCCVRDLRSWGARRKGEEI
jgi:hypothetical protein